MIHCEDKVCIADSFFKKTNNYTRISMFFIYRYLSRAVLIPFVHEVKFDLEEAKDINEVFQHAHYAFPTFLEMGSHLSTSQSSEVETIRNKITTIIPGIDARLALQYALCLSVALQVYSILIRI